MGLFKKPSIEYTADMTLGEVLRYNKKNQKILLGFGMHCFGCPVSQMETLKEAAEVHGIELQMLLDKLNGKKITTK